MRVSVALFATVVSLSSSVLAAAPSSSPAGNLTVPATNKKDGDDKAAASAPSTTPKGSIEALLERYSARTRKAVPVNTVPEDLKGSDEDKDADEKKDDAKPKDKLARREGPKRLDAGKRWIWGTSIIQDGDPTSGLPPPGQNSNGLGSYGVNTPSFTLTPPTFPPLPTSDVNIKITKASSSVAGAATPSAIPCKKTVECSGIQRPANSHHYCNPKQKQCVYLCDSGYTLNPWTKQCQKNGKANNVPRYVKNVEPHSNLHKDLQAGGHSGHKRHDFSHDKQHRRWIWATGIIQDGDAGAPPPDRNANLLSSGGYDVNTPTARLTPPTFPPRQSPTIATPAPVQQQQKQQQQVAAPSSSSSSKKKSAPKPSATVDKNVTRSTNLSSDDTAAAAGEVIAAVFASASQAAQAANSPINAILAIPGPRTAAAQASMKPKMVKKRGGQQKLQTLYPTAMYASEDDQLDGEYKRTSAKETNSVDILSDENWEDFEAGEWDESEWDDIVIFDEDKKKLL
ncbi:hypothetical protein OIO90_002570 [Microbotryomycetes sp. JL221]|nr:hypothetical protein OIO90_002570 [Microbotryomycetes sp. JL221]